MGFVRVFLAVLAFVLPVQAQDEDIRSVISDQISAFLVDDFATAFTFAAPNIKQIFQNSDRFGQMVSKSYPMVHRPAHYRFQALTDQNGSLQQDVLIRDTLGDYYIAEYSMVETANGWKISGVRIKRAAGVGV